MIGTAIFARAGVGQSKELMVQARDGFSIVVDSGTGAIHRLGRDDGPLFQMDYNTSTVFRRLEGRATKTDRSVHLQLTAAEAQLAIDAEIKRDFGDVV